MLLEPLDFIARQAALVPRRALGTRNGFASPLRTCGPCMASALACAVDCDKPLAPMIPDQVRDRAGHSASSVYSPSTLRSAGMRPGRFSRSERRTRSRPISACPECGGRLRVIASIEESWLIRKILDHVRRREALPDDVARGPPDSGLEGLR